MLISWVRELALQTLVGAPPTTEIKGKRIRPMASHATGDGAIPPRDAGERGLRRIMTLGGAYGTRNYTVKDLRDQKGTSIRNWTASLRECPTCRMRSRRCPIALPRSLR